MSNSITIAAAHSLDEFNQHGPAVTWEDFETIKKAKERAQYVLTREYANVAEMSEPFGYSQVIVDGEVQHDFFSKEAAKPVTATAPKRVIKQNAWGNWNGYVSGHKIKEFGTNEQAAREWAGIDAPAPTDLQVHAVALTSITNRMEFYRVGYPDESNTLPQAIFASPEELRALAYFIRTLPKAAALLAQAVNYVESDVAHAGKCLNAAELEKGIEAVQRVSDISTGRDAFNQAKFEIGKARAITGQPGYQDSR